MRLEEILRRRELLDESQLAKCRNGSRNPTALFQNAIREGYLDEECALRTLAEEGGPLFTEEQDAKAFELFKAKAIDREELLMLISIPMRELLIQHLKNKIEPAEARAAAEEKRLKLVQATGGGKGGS